MGKGHWSLWLIQRWLVPFSFEAGWVLTQMQGISGDAVGKKTCEICGCESEPENLVTHHVVPSETTREAGMPDSATVVLCGNCSTELYAWYDKKVFSMAYDSVTKRFRPRSPAEMVKEYETAYKVFVEYKKVQMKRA